MARIYITFSVETDDDAEITNPDIIVQDLDYEIKHDSIVSSYLLNYHTKEEEN